jgi:imidazolonepropionase-like amidohydrolase
MKTMGLRFLAISNLAAAAVGLCSGALALPAADAAPATTIVLKAAHVFDSTGTSLRDGATVVVSGDKIVSVGNGPIPAGAKVIDLGDATILPGFIDSHVHLTMELQSDYYKGFYKDMFRFPAEQAHYAGLYAKRTLEAGFTTVRNVGAEEFVDVGLRNAINAGVAEGRAS